MPARCRLAHALLVIAIVSTSSIAASTTSAPRARLLSAAADDQRPHWLATHGPSELRGRMARFDAAALGRTAQAFAAKGMSTAFTIDTFDGEAVVVDITSVQRPAAGRVIMQGAVKRAGESAAGNAVFAMVDDALEAELMLADGRRFALQHAGGTSCWLSERNPDAASLKCETGDVPAKRAAVQQHAAVTADAPEAVTKTSAVEGEPPVVDVMIVYTPALLASFSSVSAMQARCELVIATANRIFADSQINAQVRLVHAAKINYTESGEMADDLRRLLDPYDEHLDEVPALREQYQADVVHLFTYEGDRRSGMATGYPSDYHAVVMGADPYTFSHELGHNFGCQHDHDAAGPSESSYAFGRIFTGNDRRKYGCIMSYTGAAGATRLSYFSNPNVTYSGVPIGVPKGRPDSADNARMVNLTAPVIAAYRGGEPSSYTPVFATPPRLAFPITPPGSTTGSQMIILAQASASLHRAVHITDFRLEGDANAFTVEVYDPSTRQFISGPNFTIPVGGVRLFVRFKPSSDQRAEAAIRFAVNDPAHRYSPPAIRLVGNAATPMLKNISTRVAVGNGDNALIGGFIIGGSSARDVIVRALGPSLVDRGIAQPLGDPTIELYRGSELIARNDEWNEGFPRDAIRWSGLAPTADLESAILARLEPGAYTAVVRGFGDATGVGLIEAYDLEPNDAAEFLNISTRGRVGVGDNVMIGGFILGGAPPTRVVVRALGPALAAAGVGGALDDPSLEIHNSQGALVNANDNWRSGDEAAVEASGAAPEDDREAAIAATLPPGAYTAIVRGASDTQGIGIVELYKLPGD